MAQGSNNTRTARPKPGDGTQERPNPERSDANWYGASKEPQEEFIENDPQVSRVDQESHDRRVQTSEGRPTFSSNNESSTDATYHKGPRGEGHSHAPEQDPETDPTRQPKKMPVEGP